MAINWGKASKVNKNYLNTEIFITFSISKLTHGKPLCKHLFQLFFEFSCHIILQRRSKGALM